MKLICCHHGHPEDLPSGALSHGWGAYRFNGLFGPWRTPTRAAADVLRRIKAETGQKSLVVLLRANTYPFNANTQPFNVTDEPRFWERVQQRLIDPYGFGVAGLDWLAGQNLQEHVLIDMTNGPERPWRTSYPALRKYAVEPNLDALVAYARSHGFEVVDDGAVMRRHFYVHREGSSRDYWERSETIAPFQPSRIWYTEVGVHRSVPDRVAALNWLLSVGTWDGERVYVHAPYQQNDGAGYGGLWYDAAARAVLTGVMR